MFHPVLSGKSVTASVTFSFAGVGWLKANTLFFNFFVDLFYIVLTHKCINRQKINY